jgi:hypothetical protein
LQDAYHARQQHIRAPAAGRCANTHKECYHCMNLKEQARVASYPNSANGR